MRDWVKNLSEIDIDCVHQYEYLLGRPLRDYEEYREIDKQVDEMALEWRSRPEFFAAYPALEAYRKGRDKDPGKKFFLREPHEQQNGSDAPKESLASKIKSASNRVAGGNTSNGQPKTTDYSKFSIEDLLKMEKAAYAEYYKLAAKPATNPSPKDLVPLEKATAIWEAISEEIERRKQRGHGVFVVASNQLQR